MRNLLLIFLFTLASCHTSRLVNKHIDKKYARHDLNFNTFKNDEFEIRYWDSETDKPPLVLIHGFGTWAKFNWHEQLNDLGENYRLIIPNLLHFGQSICTNCGYGVSDQVKALESLFEHLNLNSYSIAGASYGGVVAMELSKNENNPINKLIIIDSPVKFFSEEEIRDVQNDFGISDISELLIPKNHQQLKSLTKVLYYSPPYAPTCAYKDIYAQMYAPYIPDMSMTLQALLDNRSDFAATEYRFNKPILLIWGSNDRLVPNRVGKNLHEYFESNSRLEIISKTAHMPILEKPKECNQLITDFLMKE